jgi:phage regulator Rha-like protein
MGHKVLKTKLRYSVLNKETKEISIYHLQKEIADLFNVSRKTILRNITDNKMYENNKYIVYLIVRVP